MNKNLWKYIAGGIALLATGFAAGYATGVKMTMEVIVNVDEDEPEEEEYIPEAVKRRPDFYREEVRVTRAKPPLDEAYEAIRKPYVSQNRPYYTVEDETEAMICHILQISEEEFDSNENYGTEDVMYFVESDACYVPLADEIWDSHEYRGYLGTVIEELPVDDIDLYPDGTIIYIRNELLSMDYSVVIRQFDPVPEITKDGEDE